jgi:plasmid stabilization system protein ParE
VADRFSVGDLGYPSTNVDKAAWSDLNKIGSWIAKDSPSAAVRELEKIEHVIKQLGRFPGLNMQWRAVAHNRNAARVCRSFDALAARELAHRKSESSLNGRKGDRAADLLSWSRALGD